MGKAVMLPLGLVIISLVVVEVEPMVHQRHQVAQAEQVVVAQAVII
jgi:hypothetical protein